MSTSHAAIRVSLRLSKQWSGAFEGEISLIHSGPTALQQWSVSFRSRHPLAMVSNFTLQQSREADGSWLITLSPPRWGGSLRPNRASRSYVQGRLPAGTRLPSLSGAELLLPASAAPSLPPASGGGDGGSGSGR